MTAGDARDAAREAFSLLGHDVRLDIVLALLEDWAAVYTEPVTYSELMDAVGVRDSGKFNYHLDRLRGVYVEQVENGYVPTASATALYRTVLAHRPMAGTGDRTIDTDHACPQCGTELVGHYERAFLTVECPTCDREPLLTYPFPENGLAVRTDGAVLDALTDRATYEIGLAATGQCPDCAGRTEVTIQRDRLDDERVPGVEIACGSCTYRVGVAALTPLQFDPEVATALVELDAHPVPGALGDDGPAVTGRVESEEPLSVAIDVETDAGSATIVVDEDLDVESVVVG